jgi:nicotinate-nucleotide adenylyltransferase
MKIGLFLGSFNPIHMGHLFIANKALEQTDIEEVWFVVSPESPDKQGDSELIDIDDRVNMVEWSIIHSPKMKVCDVERNLPIPSYTINTLRELEKQNPTHEYSIIMGSDNLNKIDTWTNFEEVRNNYRFICFDRPGYGIKNNTYNVHYMDVPRMEISASYIREELRSGRDVRFLVPNGVISYIKKNNKYYGVG